MTWLSAIVNSAQDAIIGSMLDGTIVSWNPAAQELFGYRADEVVARRITILADPDRPDEITGILSRLWRGELICRYETTRRCKDGTIVPVSVTISPVRNAAGELTGASEIARDISERRDAEERIRLRTRELYHRTQNFMAIAQAVVRLAEAETVSDFREVVAARLHSLARTHALLINDDQHKVRLLTLVREELEIFRSESTDVSVNGPSVPISAAAAQSLSLVIHELATNALKYGSLAREGGRLVVRSAWASDGGRILLNWHEVCSHPVRPPTRKGFGMTVIQRAIERQLGGTLWMDWQGEGLNCEITIPAEHVRKE